MQVIKALASRLPVVGQSLSGTILQRCEATVVYAFSETAFPSVAAVKTSLLTACFPMRVIDGFRFRRSALAQKDR
jgi:hypothetical protein